MDLYNESMNYNSERLNVPEYSIITVKKANFEKQMEELKWFAKQSAISTELDKFITGGQWSDFWCGGIPGLLTGHKVTGEEMNHFVTDLQNRFIQINERQRILIKQFEHVYKTFYFLDKEYIEGIITTVIAAKYASEEAKKAQKDVNDAIKVLKETVKASQETVSTLKQFSEKIDKKVSDIWDSIFSIKEQIYEISERIDKQESQIEALSKKVDDKQEERIDKQESQIEALSKKVDDKQEERIDKQESQIEALLKKVDDMLSKKVDDMWDRLQSLEKEINLVFELAFRLY